MTGARGRFDPYGSAKGSESGVTRPARPDVFLLGHRGMLGHTVLRWLEEQGCRVETTEEGYDGRPDSALIRQIAGSECDVVVNCIGRTDARSTTCADLFVANAFLPQHLSDVLRDGRILIHASTDGVFDGRRGGYRVDDPPDATDAYGLSKRLGERGLVGSGAYVLRTSIIGPERGSSRGLLGWFLSQTGAVDGYEDQVWNGITSLDWAKLCLQIVRGEIRAGPGVVQPASGRSISKRQLLESIADAFGHRVPIRPVISGRPINRTLVPTVERPPIEVQLRELRAWYGSLA